MKALKPRFDLEELDHEQSFMERKNNYVIHELTLPYEIEWCLTLLCEEVAKTSIHRESLKAVLNDSPDFNIREAFAFINRNNKKSLDALEYCFQKKLEIIYFIIFSFSIFLKTMGKTLTKNEVIAFIKAVDTDNDGKVSFEDFFEMVIPPPPPDIYNSQPKIVPISFDKKAPQTELSRMKQLEAEFSLDTSLNSFERSKNRISLDSLSEKITILKTRLSFEQDNLRPRISNTPKRIPKLTQKVETDFSTPKGFGGLKFYNLEEDERRIARLLKTQVEKERECEDVRKEMAMKSDFNLLDSFRFFDRKGKSYVGKQEFSDALKILEIRTSKEAIDLFFMRYDRNKDGLLELFEFFLDFFIFF